MDTYRVPGPAHRQGRTWVGRTVYQHNPYAQAPYRSRYFSPREYHVTINEYYIYLDWVQEPVDFWYTDGYWEIDNYPYYVDNGYRYRYSSADQCQYDLVDGNDYTIVARTELDECNLAYDTCAAERDGMNTRAQMDRFFCAESVDDDLRVETGDQYFPLPKQMSEAKRATIEAFLKGKTKKDLWREGWYEGVGSCFIVKLRGNENGCRWLVKVGENTFPDPQGKVCSAPEQAALIGCKENDEKGNAGCILEKAIREGYCHE